MHGRPIGRALKRLRSSRLAQSDSKLTANWLPIRSQFLHYLRPQTEVASLLAAMFGIYCDALLFVVPVNFMFQLAPYQRLIATTWRRSSTDITMPRSGSERASKSSRLAFFQSTMDVRAVGCMYIVESIKSIKRKAFTLDGVWCRVRASR